MTYFCNQASFHCTCKVEVFLSYFELKTLFFVFSEREFSNIKLNHSNRNVRRKSLNETPYKRELKHCKSCFPPGFSLTTSIIAEPGMFLKRSVVSPSHLHIHDASHFLSKDDKYFIKNLILVLFGQGLGKAQISILTHFFRVNVFKFLCNSNALVSLP